MINGTHKNIIGLALSALLFTACGSKEDAAPKPPAPKPKTEKKDDAQGAPPATTDAAPPPAPVTPAATPEAAPGGSADAATSTGSGDVLARFRQGDNGKILTDVEALQVVCDLYSRKAGISEGEGIPVQPSLKGNDLSLLVKFKYLTGLPTPPEGQKFVMDQKTMKVKLVNK